MFSRPWRTGAGKEGAHRQQVERRQVHFNGVAGVVRQPQRPGHLPEVGEQVPPPRHPLQQVVALRADARREQDLQLTELFHGDEDAVAGFGQGAGVVHHLLEDIVKVQAFIDLQRGLAQPRQPVACRVVVGAGLDGMRHVHSSRPTWSRPETPVRVLVLTDRLLPPCSSD